MSDFYLFLNIYYGIDFHIPIYLNYINDATQARDSEVVVTVLTHRTCVGSFKRKMDFVVVQLTAEL